ncbi:hypothetical protein [Marinoscillum pacificum]|uniref:hypothetical protein n=1 Tax=Marinoscillum pacificum TaxID=392723 RepID=UPI002158427C|nr:hypothetical protein [Marinoscillum pacificum]
MEIKDLIITPIYIILLSLIAYFIRPYVTTKETRKYFLPALWVRFFGAIMLGIIYQFYYGGGDTFNYFTHGSRWIWEAFLDDPILGFKLLMESGGERVGETFPWSQHIWYYKDPHSFFIVRLAALFDVFTFHTYSATALFFATFSFSGLWSFYSAVVKKYTGNAKWLAISILFVPSVVFWGSGILKDTITLGALGWLTFVFIQVIDFGNKNPFYWGIALISVFLIFSIKIYIVICYLPMVFLWLYWKYQSRIGNSLVKILVAPFLITIFAGGGYFALQRISSSSNKYSLDNIAYQARVTAYDIRYGWGARTGGDGGYDIGIPDGTIPGMLKLMPAAINVSLFRPYLWEVKNPLMLLSALESIMILALSIWFVIVQGGFKRLISDPFLVFCFAFALLFAFAVGVSTANFGTLMRYKIPMMCFYAVVLVISSKHNRLVS